MVEALSKLVEGLSLLRFQADSAWRKQSQGSDFTKNPEALKT